MRQSWHRTEGVVGDRIVEFALLLCQFVGRRDDLKPYRIGGVVPVDQVEIGLGDANLVARGRGFGRRPLGWRQRQRIQVAYMPHALANIVLPCGIRLASAPVIGCHAGRIDRHAGVRDVGM